MPFVIFVANSTSGGGYWLRAFVPGWQDVTNCDKSWTRWDVTRCGQGLTSCD